MAAKTGKNLGYELKSYLGMYDQIIQSDVPLSWIVNTNVVSVSGDTVEFDYFVVPEEDFSQHGTYPISGDSCAGAEVECLGTNKITHTLNREYDKLYPLKKCRISNMANTAKVTNQSVQSLVDGYVGAIEEKYARGLAKYLVNSLVETYTTIKEFTPSASATSILEEIEESVVNIENLHETGRDAQTIIMTYTASSALRELNYECCEITTALVPEDQNKIGVEKMVKVPDAWLKKADDTQYSFVNYVKDLYTYRENCAIARTVELTNTLDGYLGYHKSAVWGAFLDESVAQIPEVKGTAGNKVQ